jgi:tetratricopeptide (TPR) repeat protein
MLGRQDLAREELARLRREKITSEGSTDETLALAALLGDVTLAQEYLPRALAHLRKVTRPEDADKAERGVRALGALAAGQNQDAYDLAASLGDDYSQRTSMFVAAIAAYRLQRYDEAARTFEKILAFKTRLGLSASHGLARLMLARSYAGAGDKVKARAAYEEALRFWKDAESDLPLLEEAKKEYAAL